MYMLNIWTVDGQVRSIPMTEDMLDYEIQVLETDPAVECYTVCSL